MVTLLLSKQQEQGGRCHLFQKTNEDVTGMFSTAREVVLVSLFGILTKCHS